MKDLIELISEEYRNKIMSFSFIVVFFVLGIDSIVTTTLEIKNDLLTIFFSFGIIIFNIILMVYYYKNHLKLKEKEGSNLNHEFYEEVFKRHKFKE